MASTDVFGKTTQTIQQPITADKVLIDWGGIVTGATNFTLQYAQPIARRRTIGNGGAVIYSGQPNGSIQLGELMTTENIGTLFSSPGWNVCNPATITIHFAAGCEISGTSALSLTCTAAVVTNLGIAGEAEGLTVVNNVGIEFLQLFAD